MMRYLWIAVLLMLVCGVVVSETETQNVTHYIKDDATIDGQKHRIDLFELSSEKGSDSQLPDALIIAEKKGDESNDISKRFFIAVRLNQQCALFSGNEDYSSAEEINSKTETIGKKWGVDTLLSIPLKEIDDKSEVMEGKWENRTSSFKNRKLVMESLWEQAKCKDTPWADMDGILSGKKENSVSDNNENDMSSAVAPETNPSTNNPNNETLLNDHANLKNNMEGKQKKTTSIEADIEDQKGMISGKDNDIEQREKSFADFEIISAKKFISALLDNLDWEFWKVVVIVFSFIIAYIFILWFIAKLVYPIQNDTENIIKWFATTDSTLREIKTQMPRRSVSSLDLSNQLKEIYGIIAEKATKICDLNPRFQALFAQLQKNERIAGEWGVNVVIVLPEDQRPQNSSQIKPVDQSNQIDKDALQIRQLLDEIKESHSKNVALTYNRLGHIDSLKSHSDLALSRIPVLLNIMLQFSEHIASLFHATLYKLSQVSNEKQLLKEDLAIKSEEVVAESKRATDYSHVLADELKEIGYLDRKGEFDEIKFNEALTKFRNDIQKRPEFLEYGRSLSSLRRYLTSERLQKLPYFDAVGLRELSNNLDKKNSLSKLFESETPAGNLKGHWKDILLYIYRAILLLDTYWPNADMELRAKLEQTRATTDLLLRSQGIAPHIFSLLEEAKVDNTTIQETRTATIPRVLELDETFRDRVKPLSDTGITYCDVAYWGYDIIRDDQVTLGKPTLLVTKELGVPWE